MCDWRSPKSGMRAGSLAGAMSATRRAHRAGFPIWAVIGPLGPIVTYSQREYPLDRRERVNADNSANTPRWLVTGLTQAPDGLGNQRNALTSAINWLRPCSGRS